MSKAKKTPLEVVGLLPAAGRGTRIAPLPCSKELYPIGFHEKSGKEPTPKPVCEYLLENMRFAGIGKAYIVLRPGKWDIPAYLGDGASFGMHLAYLTLRDSPGSPYSLDCAFPFVRDFRIALGFPDIILRPDDMFARLLARQAVTGAEVVLGLFRAEDPRKVDMVESTEYNRIVGIDIKPATTTLRHTWMAAVWTPAFTRFMHEHLAAIPPGAERELHVGDVIQAAIAAGLTVEGEFISDGSYIDIGTPEDLQRAARLYNT